MATYFAELDVYALHIDGQVHLYFMKLNQKHIVGLPDTINLTSAKRLTLVALPEELQVSGFILIAFGQSDILVDHIFQDDQSGALVNTFLKLHEMPRKDPQNVITSTNLVSFGMLESHPMGLDVDVQKMLFLFPSGLLDMVIRGLL